jgi:hypothetical protein
MSFVGKIGKMLRRKSKKVEVVKPDGIRSLNVSEEESGSQSDVENRYVSDSEVGRKRSVSQTSSGYNSENDDWHKSIPIRGFVNVSDINVKKLTNRDLLNVSDIVTIAGNEKVKTITFSISKDHYEDAMNIINLISEKKGKSAIINSKFSEVPKQTKMVYPMLSDFGMRKFSKGTITAVWKYDK